jgi:hypothetical protein
MYSDAITQHINTTKHKGSNFAVKNIYYNDTPSVLRTVIYLHENLLGNLTK